MGGNRLPNKERVKLKRIKDTKLEEITISSENKWALKETLQILHKVIVPSSRGRHANIYFVYRRINPDTGKLYPIHISFRRYIWIPKQLSWVCCGIINIKYDHEAKELIKLLQIYFHVD